MENIVENLVRVSRARGKTPWEVSTLYKLHHTKRFPGLFVKLAGALFVDLKALKGVIEAGRQGEAK